MEVIDLTERQQRAVEFGYALPTIDYINIVMDSNIEYVKLLCRFMEKYSVSMANAESHSVRNDCFDFHCRFFYDYDGKITNMCLYRDLNEWPDWHSYYKPRKPDERFVESVIKFATELGCEATVRLKLWQDGEKILLAAQEKFDSISDDRYSTGFLTVVENGISSVGKFSRCLDFSPYLKDTYIYKLKGKRSGVNYKPLDFLLLDVRKGV